MAVLQAAHLEPEFAEELSQLWVAGACSAEGLSLHLIPVV